jgi:hypothetical protein
MPDHDEASGEHQQSYADEDDVVGGLVRHALSHLVQAQDLVLNDPVIEVEASDTREDASPHSSRVERS